MEKVYIIHENGEWVAPLRERLKELRTPFKEWNLVQGTVPIDEVPPEGIFYNRMSASSYTRDHRFSPEYAAVVMTWLEAHNRTIVNDSRALALEINKAAQYQILRAAGIKTPRTVVAVGNDAILEAAESFGDEPLILKPNRGGKGDGVQLFENVEQLQEHINAPDYEPPVDGISMVQEYIYAPDRSITRAEFIGGKFFYAVRVDTSDVCQVPGERSEPMFRVFEGHGGLGEHVIAAAEQVLADNGVKVAGIEFIRDEAGELYAYDINTNTNYNPDAEAVADKFGMRRLAGYLTELLIARSGVAEPLLKAI
jgi:hypothetical protein